MVEQSGRVAIVIAGMHRSGTSALAKAIAIHGAELPKRLLVSTKGNIPGHWEPAALVELNDQFLNENGSRWDDWRRFEVTISPARREDFKAAILEALKSSYEQFPLFVLKDPRICRFIPFYEAVFQRAGITPRYVLPYRHPLEVAKSLESRDGMPIRYGQLLWARHVLDAEKATRGTLRVFATYDDLLADPVRCLADIALKLEIKWPRPARTAKKELLDFLQPDHRNFLVKTAVAPANDEIEAFVQEIHDNLDRLKTAPFDPVATANLDRLKSDLDHPSSNFRHEVPAVFAFEDVRAGSLLARVKRPTNRKPVLGGIWERARRFFGG